MDKRSGKKKKQPKHDDSKAVETISTLLKPSTVAPTKQAPTPPKK